MAAKEFTMSAKPRRLTVAEDGKNSVKIDISDRIAAVRMNAAFLDMAIEGLRGAFGASDALNGMSFMLGRMQDELASINHDMTGEGR